MMWGILFFFLDQKTFWVSCKLWPFHFRCWPLSQLVQSLAADLHKSQRPYGFCCLRASLMYWSENRKSRLSMHFLYVVCTNCSRFSALKYAQPEILKRSRRFDRQIRYSTYWGVGHLFLIGWILIIFSVLMLVDALSFRKKKRLSKMFSFRHFERI